jgi:hypothetical protein
MFPDPESAYLQGRAWHEEALKNAEKKTPDKDEGGEENDSGTDSVS